MKEFDQNTTQTESPLEGKDLTRIGDSVTPHRAGSGRPHKGLDLFALAGSPVRAAVDGKVLRVVDGAAGNRASQKRAGWFVDILGADGLIYRYLHLGEKPTVRAGQFIQAGTQLGAVGTSGIQHAQPHVHFEIRRGDYSNQQRDYGEPVDPLTVLPLGNITNGGSRMAEKKTQEEATDRDASIRPAAIDLNAPDAKAAMTFLISKGWTPDEIELLLNKHVSADATDQRVEYHLLSLGWSKSDVARLLVGPGQAHKTAESLFRQHAANSDEDQQALLKALIQAGAQNVKLDPSLLSGLNEKHLSPENPSDLQQMISQFAGLPDVQKQRFLLLLDSQKPNKKTPAANPDVTNTSTPRASGTDSSKAKPSGSSGDVMPVVKSSLDLLSTALKGLLGTTKDGTKKGASGSPKGGTKNQSKDESESDSDSDDSTSQTDDDTPEGESGDEKDKPSPDDDNGSSPSEPEGSMDSDSESVPD